MIFPKISVVISARNEEKHIANCLLSIKQEKYPKNKIEVIVIDDGSVDNTAKIAKEHGAQIIHSSRNKKGTKNFRGANVNTGVKHSTGEIIFFPDADMTFDPELFSEIAKKFNKFDALYIPETMIGRGLFGTIRNFERSFYDQTPVDAVRVVKKNIFFQVGGYDEKNILFGADDWDLTKSIKKITKKVSITRNRLYHHEELLSWKTFLLKKTKYVHTFDGYIKKWGTTDPDIRFQLGVWHRSVTVFFEKGKWKKLFSRPDLASLMYILRFFTWISYKFG